MIFNSLSDTITYFNTLLNTGVQVSHSNVIKILEKNNLTISKTILNEGKGDTILLKSIEDDKNGAVILTLDAPSWIKILPSFYHDNTFLQRFLFGFQLSDMKYQNIIETIDNQFNPSKSDFVDWLSTWVGVKFAQEVSDKAKRRVLHNIIHLYKIRGTKLYFIELLSYLTGVTIRIEDEQEAEPLHGSLQRRTSKHATSIFTIYIDEKLSEDLAEEKILFQIVHDVVDTEKPINVAFNIEYPFKEDEVQSKQLNVIDMHYENYYDYDTTRDEL